MQSSHLALALLAAAGSWQGATAQKIGTVRFPTSCRADAAADFNRSTALLHSFAFGTAREGFQEVLRKDPRCAMAWWGIALSNWGNPFAAGIKPPAQIARGLAAVNEGRKLGAPTPREAGYLEAVARLYERADSVDQRTRLLAYRDAMAELVRREPADSEAAILHALALAISADPADKTYAGQLTGGATLERLFARLPDHPGLAHYIIHTYDVPSLAGRAERAAVRYAEIAPVLSHALHMPSHTYTRIGAWEESIASNNASADAARREGSTAEELHANDYRAYAYLQTGRDSLVRRLIDELPALAAKMDPNATSASAAPPAAGYYAIAAIPARYALERGDWAAAARLEFRPSPTAFADAVTLFARALGAARSGDTAAARTAITELGGIRDRLDRAGERYWTEQTEIQIGGARAWLMFKSGPAGPALELMRQVAEREDRTEKNAITPGPLAPARELLGEMLLETGRPADAAAEFRLVLAKEPNRRRAAAGLARAEAQRPPEDFAVTHVNVVPMTRDTVLRDVTVTVRGGRIASVGRQAPVGIRVIDGTGKYLIPGLADMHTHLFSDDALPDSLAPVELGAMLAYGLTAARLMIGTPEQLTLRGQVARGEVVGPQLWLASPHLTGNRNEGNALVVTTPDEARAAVRQSAEAGYDFIKITNNVPPEVYDAIMNEADARRIRVDGHVDPRFGVAHALARRQNLQHLDGYFEAVLADSAPSRASVTQAGLFRLANWTSLDYVDDRKVDALAGATARAGVWVTPTLRVFNVAFAKGQTEAEVRARPDWALLTPEHQTLYLRALGRYWAPANDTARTPARRARFIATRNRIVKAISDSGGAARLLAGSDTPEWFMAYGRTLHTELESFVEAGLTPWQALATATRNPAEFLGASREWGTIEAGKRADLVLLGGNPLADIRNTARIEGVAVGGRWMDRAALDAMIARAAAALSP